MTKVCSASGVRDANVLHEIENEKENGCKIDRLGNLLGREEYQSISVSFENGRGGSE